MKSRISRKHFSLSRIARLFLCLAIFVLEPRTADYIITYIPGPYGGAHAVAAAKLPITALNVNVLRGETHVSLCDHIRPAGTRLYVRGGRTE